MRTLDYVAWRAAAKWARISMEQAIQTHQSNAGQGAAMQSIGESEIVFSIASDPFGQRRESCYHCVMVNAINGVIVTSIAGPNQRRHAERQSVRLPNLNI